MQPREVRAISVGSAYRVDLDTDHHHWNLDESIAVAGTDTGPTPVEAMLGALVSCLTISFQFSARRKSVPIQKIDGWIASNPERFVDKIEVELTVWSSADEATVRDLLPRAERGCYVKALLRPDLEISIDLAVLPVE